MKASKAVTSPDWKRVRRVERAGEEGEATAGRGEREAKSKKSDWANDRAMNRLARTEEVAEGVAAIPGTVEGEERWDSRRVRAEED